MSNQDQPRLRPAMIPAPLAEFARRIDNLEVENRAVASRAAALSYAPPTPPDLPSWVDHSVHVKYIRDQGAYGCGLNAAAACWDILLAKYCAPYTHPNISVNRMLWAWAWTLRCWPEDVPCGARKTLPIPGLAGASYNTLDEYLNCFGCPAEGTELTNSDAVQWPTDAGNAECPHYRLDRHPQAVAPNFHRDVKVDLNELKYWLKGGPVRVGIWGNHFVTLVGYDDSTQRLKFLNSWGDRWEENGFGYVDYARIHEDLDSAQVYQFVPPPAVPCARVRFTSQWRQDVQLWVGVEGTNMVKRIWPSGQRQDVSWNLWLTVTLPTGFAWPPSPQNRLFLDVYDAGAHSNAGGAIHEFSAHLGDQHRFCEEILQGIPDPDNTAAGSGIVPRSFSPRQLVHVTIQ
jgi:hypothetical protein